MLLERVNTAELADKFAAEEPFPFLCFDEFLPLDFASELAVSYPSYDDALTMGRVFNNVNEHDKIQVSDFAHFPGPVNRLCAMLSSDDFLDTLSRVTGIDGLRWDNALFGGGMQLMSPGSYLDVHVDFNQLEDRQLYRRLNLIIYLNEQWEDGWGGETEIWDTQVRQRHHAVEPRLGRGLLFETSDHSFHGVAQVCSPGITRQTFSAYYYTAEPPPGSDSKYHDTIFRARPQERMKRYVTMPLEGLGRRARQAYWGMRRVAGKLLKGQ